MVYLVPSASFISITIVSSDVNGAILVNVTSFSDSLYEKILLLKVTVLILLISMLSPTPLRRFESVILPPPSIYVSLLL